MSKILVVDDDPSILTFIDEALSNDHEVFKSESVDDAEKIMQNNAINLLIADLVMPEKNGIDMIMSFKKLYPDLHIMAISGGGGITGRFDYLPIAQLVGAEITLKKPFTIEELRKNVSSILNTPTEE